MCVCVCERECVYVCVCVREREKKVRESVAKRVPGGTYIPLNVLLCADRTQTVVKLPRTPRERFPATPRGRVDLHLGSGVVTRKG